MKFLAFVAILVSSLNVFADSASLEACAYSESRIFLEGIQKVNRLRNPSQLESVAKFIRNKCVETNGLGHGLSDDEASAAVRNGVQRMATEIFGAEVLEQGTRQWNEIAIERLTSAMRTKFQDTSITISNPEVLNTEENNKLSGTVTLSNKYTCEVSSQVSQNHSGCSVYFWCHLGSKVEFQSVQANCKSF